MNSLVGLGATASFAVSCVAAALPALRWKTFFEEPAMLLGRALQRHGSPLTWGQNSSILVANSGAATVGVMSMQRQHPHNAHTTLTSTVQHGVDMTHGVRDGSVTTSACDTVLPGHFCL
jgi:hypothetical protein